MWNLFYRGSASQLIVLVAIAVEYILKTPEGKAMIYVPEHGLTSLSNLQLIRHVSPLLCLSW